MAKRKSLEFVAPIDKLRVNKYNAALDTLEAPNINIGSGHKRYFNNGIGYNMHGQLIDYVNGGIPITQDSAIRRLWNGYLEHDTKNKRIEKNFINTLKDVYFDKYRRPEYRKYDLSGKTIKRISK